MIYQIRAGGYTFYTADTEFLASDGVYYGNSNLYVGQSFDRNANTYNNYIFPVSRTVYFRASGSSTYQYLTITQVTPLHDKYYSSDFGGGVDSSVVSLLLLGVIVVCTVFRTFFRS